jgi:hypothetical protein
MSFWSLQSEVLHVVSSSLPVTCQADFGGRGQCNLVVDSIFVACKRARVRGLDACDCICCSQHLLRHLARKALSFGGLGSLSTCVVVLTASLNHCLGCFCASPWLTPDRRGWSTVIPILPTTFPFDEEIAYHDVVCSKFLVDIDSIVNDARMQPWRILLGRLRLLHCKKQERTIDVALQNANRE